MARPRKPLAAQKGNIKVIDMQKKKQAEDAYHQDRDLLYIKPVDRLIDENASRMWDIITAEIYKNDFYSNIDLFNLTSYCNAVANYMAVEEKLKNKQFLIKNKKGEIVENPLLLTKKRCLDEVTRFERLAGISIDCRLRIGENKVQNQEDEIMMKFGNI